MRMCERGTTEEVIIDGRSISIDSCIAEKVDSLNKGGTFKTLGCCCGHGIYPATIIARWKGWIVEYYTGVSICRKRNFYRRDASGVYFLPEVKEKVSK